MATTSSPIISGVISGVIAVGLVGALLGCGPHGSGDDDGDDDVPRDAAIDSPPPIDAPVIPPIPAHCLAAADRGVTWLVNHQQFDGSWGQVYPVAATAFAVLKLETYAREIGRSPFDPGFQYATQVARGLDYLFNQAVVQPISPQPAGNPDTDGNGAGLTFSGLMYEDGIVLMALAGGGEPDRIVTTATGPLQGWTYRAVVHELVDYISFAQSDGAALDPSCSHGGWRYSAFDHDPSVGDNSVSQFVTLGLEYARHPQYHYEIAPPAWVTSELSRWVTCIQIRDGGPFDGASGYDDPTNGFFINAYKTGALIQQYAFLGALPTEPAVLAALGYLGRVWNDFTGAGWHGSPSDYLTMYSIMKAMESMAITEVDGHDWYTEFCTQLEAEQHADGSWSVSNWDAEAVNDSGLLSTEWALLVLERAAPPPEIIP